MNEEQCMFELYKKCCSDMSAFEIWEGYYNIRFEEFKKFYRIFPKKQLSETLEIGCGIGYQSALLSCVSKRVIASDVDYGGMIQHSRGLDLTKKFVSETGIQNIEVVNANAENLPFNDDQFDFIYCSYSFQYILDKSKALHEINRVLKKGGYFFCVLPTTVYRIKAAGKYYTDILPKIPGIIRNFVSQSNIAEDNNQMVIPKKKHTRLLPQPDDDNNSFLSELYLYSTTRWKQLFLKNGCRIKKVEYTSFNNAKSGFHFLSTLKERLISDGIIIVTTK